MNRAEIARIVAAVTLAAEEKKRLETGAGALLPRPWDRPVMLLLLGDPLKDLSPNVNPAGSFSNPRGSMLKKNRLVGYWRKKMFAAWEAAGSPVFTVPVEIEFSVYRRRRLDPDNVLAGLKHVTDGLTSRSMGRQGMIPDDASRWVRFLPAVCTGGKAFAETPHVWVAVRPQASALDGVLES